MNSSVYQKMLTILKYFEDFDYNNPSFIKAKLVLDSNVKYLGYYNDVKSIVQM